MAKQTAKLAQPIPLRKRNASSRAAQPPASVEELQARLDEAEETLRAIQSGDVDAIIVSGAKGERVFTLRGAEYAYRSVVEAMNEGAGTISAEGIVLYCNGHIPRVLQVPQEQVIGHPAASFVAHGDKHTFAALFACALAGEPCKSELRLRAQDGTEVPVYVSMNSLQVNDAPAVCMVVTDLREHKKRDELIEAGNLARSILEHAAEAIAVCDQHARIVLGNEALRQLCGRDPRFERFDDVLPLEIVGNSLLASRQSQPFSARSALAGGGVKAEEVVFRRPDGAVYWLLVTAGPLLSGGEIVGCIFSLMDITNRKLAEKAMLRAEKLAATGQLAATIAHEINNPLTAVYNLLYLIEGEIGIQTIHQHAGLALSELSRVSRITRQMLAFHRESTGPENIRIAQVLDEITTLFRNELEVHQATFEPHYEIPGEVFAYADDMRQIFSNLIRNALEALPVGGAVRVYVKRSRHGGKDGVGIFICDNGSGIRPELRNRIFDPFFTTKGHRGTGLGLWVAKDLVQKHDGIIRVRSSIVSGRTGSCFYVFLPSALGKQSV